ncbi:MAG: hypothetical protein CMG80_04250 [Marinobacter sp.]|nr:hypothetical protein [Marinobacter sp.]|tara:strand:- start:13040 stop:15259 length:2220 start_codon:yes stop_codon:yes gene_type:complete
MSATKMSDITYGMNIQTFYDKIVAELKQPIYRHIQVNLKNGKKIPFDEKNNMTIDEIKHNIGQPSRNTLSLYVKHVPDLYVIDFDTKQLGGCDLYYKLLQENVARTETTKGHHFYVYIKGIKQYTNQQKVYKGNRYDMDLIKKNNIWETKSRTIQGSIKTYSWDDLQEFFDVSKMGFSEDVSPPISPPQSEDDNTSIEDEEQNECQDDEVEIKVLPLPKCELEQFKEHLNSFKPRYDYDSWLKIGMICYNNFDGSNVGLNLWNEYSKDDEEGYEGKKKLREKYLTFNGDGNKLSYKQFIRWSIIDFPPKNKYESWYKTNTFIEEMNKECMYYTATGDILYFSNKIFIRNKPAIAKQYYKSYSFEIEVDKKTKKINPFDVWLESIDRKNVDRIVFNPKDDCDDNEFNIWKGFAYKQTDDCDVTKIQKWLDHIKSIWADDDETTFEYILNWFARILQQPWKKNNICLVLHSIEGVGKSFILDMIGKIIGKDYYYSTSSLKHILGDFNGDAEGKILVNLNETNWGGDKKMVGAFKEFITDNSIVINKKGIQSYTIDNYANTIITTNEEWIVNINNGDRRFNLRECKNEKYSRDYYEEISKTPLQEIANYLYSRDITHYDPRDFVKSELHKLQVEKNMDSIEVFWKNVIEGDIQIFWDDNDDEIDEEDDWGNCIREKRWLYKKYCEKIQGTHEVKYNNVHFWRKVRKLCPSMKIINSKIKDKPSKYKLPKFEIAMKEWEQYSG